MFNIQINANGGVGKKAPLVSAIKICTHKIHFSFAFKPPVNAENGNGIGKTVLTPYTKAILERQPLVFVRGLDEAKGLLSPVTYDFLIS